jgi:hypothetical protein
MASKKTNVGESLRSVILGDMTTTDAKRLRIAERVDSRSAKQDLVGDIYDINNEAQENQIAATARSQEIDPIYNFGDMGASRAISFQEEYPTLNAPIQQGVYQGSQIGSVPIFAANPAVIPMEVIRSRRKALREAYAKMEQDMSEVEMISLSRGAEAYNDVMYAKAYEGLEKDLEKHGYSYRRLLQNPKDYQAFMKRVTQLNNVMDKSKWVEKEIDRYSTQMAEDKDLYVPQKLRNIMMKWNTGDYDSESWLDGDAKQLNEIVAQFREYRNLQNTVEGMISSGSLKLDKTVVSSTIDKLNQMFQNNELEESTIKSLSDAYRLYKSTGDYDAFITATFQAVPDDRIDVIADQMAESGEYFQDKDEIKKYIRAMAYKSLEVDLEALNRYNWQARAKGVNATQKDSFFSAVGNSYFGTNSNVLRPDLKSSISEAGNDPARISEALNKAGNSKSWSFTDGVYKSKIKIPPERRELVENVLISSFDKIKSPYDGRFYTVDGYRDELLEDLESAKAGDANAWSVIEKVDGGLNPEESNYWSKLRSESISGMDGVDEETAGMYVDMYIEHKLLSGTSTYASKYKNTEASLEIQKAVVDANGVTTYIPTGKSLSDLMKAGAETDLVVAVTYTPVSTTKGFVPDPDGGSSPISQDVVVSKGIGVMYYNLADPTDVTALDNMFGTGFTSQMNFNAAGEIFFGGSNTGTQDQESEAADMLSN